MSDLHNWDTTEELVAFYKPAVKLHNNSAMVLLPHFTREPTDRVLFIHKVDTHEEVMKRVNRFVRDHVRPMV